MNIAAIEVTQAAQAAQAGAVAPPGPATAPTAVQDLSAVSYTTSLVYRLSAPPIRPTFLPGATLAVRMTSPGWAWVQTPSAQANTDGSVSYSVTVPSDAFGQTINSEIGWLCQSAFVPLVDLGAKT